MNHDCFQGRRRHGVRRMWLRSWDKLPDFLRTKEIRTYYDTLCKHRVSLVLKRLFDFFVSLIMLLVLWPFMLIIAIVVKLDSPGSALFAQERVTTYGKRFKIWKYRTMVSGAEKKGTAVTVKGDTRITRVGMFLRKKRLDELPQLVNILVGDMSFVGTRPEVVKYVDKYQPVYYATLLLPAGVTSEASIRYKDEFKLLAEADNVDKVYLEEVLPAKMAWNLKAIKEFAVHRELATMIRTILAILGKEYN